MKPFKCRWLLLLSLLWLSVPSFGYVTVASSSLNVSPGEEFTIFVPDVPVGYVDKALWGCSDPNLLFLSKDEVSATVKASPNFSGTSVIELYYTEKYLNSQGYTRANTYYKQYVITASGASASNMPTEIVLPSIVEIPVGTFKRLSPGFEPAGTSALLSCITPSDNDIASVFVTGMVIPQSIGIQAYAEGTTQATLSTENNVTKTITVKVTPPAFPGIDDGSGNADNDKNLLKSVKRIENLVNKCLQYKNDL